MNASRSYCDTADPESFEVVQSKDYRFHLEICLFFTPADTHSTREQSGQMGAVSYLAYLFQSRSSPSLFLLAEAGVRTRVVVVVALFSVRQLSAPWLEGTDRKCNKYKMPPTWPPTTTASAARDRSNQTSARMEPERPIL